MQASLDRALTLVLQSEGPELNIGGSEPGGASKYGVSVTALSDQYKAHGKPAATVDDVRNLTEADARAFYTERFAVPIRFNDLPAGVDYRLLDIEINLGPTGGVWALGLALGVWPLPDKITDDLVAKAKAVDPKMLIAALGAVWISRKHESAGWPKYGHGWTNRKNAADASALAMIGG